MFENPRRGRQARNFTTNVPKILDLKSSSEQIFFRNLSLGAPVIPVKERERVSGKVSNQRFVTSCLANSLGVKIYIIIRTL